MCCSDDVFRSELIVPVSLLELEALSAVWARAAYLDAVLHGLIKAFFFYYC